LEKFNIDRFKRDWLQLFDVAIKRNHTIMSSHIRGLNHSGIC
jgi:hypothetical protein